MSRSGYSDDCDNEWMLIRCRGAVASAMRGKRGQAFLYEMLHALHSLPEHKLIAEDLEKDGRVCAIGAVGKARGIDMAKLDPEDAEGIAAAFGISPALAREIVFENDDDWSSRDETPEARFIRMRKWIEDHILKESAEGASMREVSGGTNG